AGRQAAIVEQRGDLAYGVLVKQTIDGSDDLRRGLTRDPYPLWWRDDQGARRAAAEADLQSDVVCLEQRDVLDQQTRHPSAGKPRTWRKEAVRCVRRPNRRGNGPRMWRPSPIRIGF